MKKYEWMKNDTAAIMFSAIEGAKQSRLFRLSAVFKNEEIDPERLKKAVENIIPRYPLLMYRDVKGYYWAYLEKCDEMPAVLPEENRPAELRRLGRDGAPEIVFLYYKRRISIEANHVYGDGTGFVEILKSVIAEYMVLGGADKNAFDGVRFGDEACEAEELENAFRRYATKEKLKKVEREESYVLPKDYVKDYQNYICGILPFDELKPLCKERDITVTEFVASVMILAIIRSAKEPVNKSIIIDIPVNLRQFFPSKTIRNFTSPMPIHFNPEGRTDVTLDEIIEATRGQLKKYNTKENQQAFINHSFALTQNLPAQLVLSIFKQWGMNAIQKKTHNTEMTVVFTNMGNIKIPQIMSDAIERFELVGGDARVYDMSVFTSAISVNGYMHIGFNYSTKDVSFCREFFRILASYGVSVRVESSDENGVEAANEAYPKMCSECNVRIGEEYGKCPLCGSVPEKAGTADSYFKTALYPQPYKPYKHVPRKKKNKIYDIDRFHAWFNMDPS